MAGNKFPKPYDPAGVTVLKALRSLRKATGQQAVSVRADLALPSGSYAGVAPRDVALAGGVGSGGTFSVTGTDNHLVRMDGTSALQDSDAVMSDIGEYLAVDHTAGTNWAALYPGSLFGIGTTTFGVQVIGGDTYIAADFSGGDPRLVISLLGTQKAMVYKTATIEYHDAGGGFGTTLAFATPTAARTITLPNASGTVALTSDITVYTAGDGLTLTAGDFDVNVDHSTIEINADTLRVKAAGIANSHLAARGAVSRVMGSGSGGTGVIDLTAERLLSIDADGIGLSISAASRVVGTGSGGTTPLELVAERGLDIDANGIGIATAGVTAAMLATIVKQPPDVVSLTSADFPFGGDYTVPDTVGFIYLDATGFAGTETLTLPAAATYGPHRIVFFVGTGGGGDLTITAPGGNQVQGATLLFGASTNDATVIYSDGVNKWTCIP